jgi:DNA repair protein RadC
MRLPWQRPREAADLQPAAPPKFDAIISLGPDNLPPGVAPARGIAATRQAVQALSGAGWISVEHHPHGTRADAIEIFPADPNAPGLAAIHGLVEAATTRALNALAPRPADQPAAPARAEPSPWPTAANAPTAHRFGGFAEATSAFDWHPGVSYATTEEPPGDDRLHNLYDADLLSRLLACVDLRDGPNVAAAAVARIGSFAAVLSATELDLCKLPGLGTQSVAAIKLVHAAALRLARGAVIQQPVLDQPDRLIAYLTAVLARESIEHFRILFLDEQGRLRADEAQARGTVNHTPVYPREVVRRALELGATSIILVHNHPSGDPTPSADDIAMTGMIKDAAMALGLQVSDHIIVGNGRWLSFAKEGLL